MVKCRSLDRELVLTLFLIVCNAPFFMFGCLKCFYVKYFEFPCCWNMLQIRLLCLLFVSGGSGQRQLRLPPKLANGGIRRSETIFYIGSNVAVSSSLYTSMSKNKMATAEISKLRLQNWPMDDAQNKNARLLHAVCYHDVVRSSVCSVSRVNWTVAAIANSLFCQVSCSVFPLLGFCLAAGTRH